MRSCGLESSKSLNCPGNCLSCAHHLHLLLLLLLLVLLSDGAALLARRTSSLQIHCLECCCLSDWMFHVEPFMETQIQMSKPTFTIQQSRPNLHLWTGVIMGVCVCVYRRGLKSVVTYCKHTLTVYKNQCMLHLNWMMPLSYNLCIRCQNKRRLVPRTLMTMFTAQKQWNCTWTHKPIYPVWLETGKNMPPTFQIQNPLTAGRQEKSPN